MDECKPLPGGDIKMTALMETLPPPAGAGPGHPRAGEDTAAAQLQEWGGSDVITDTGDGGGGRWASRWAPPRTIFAEEAEVGPATYFRPTHLNRRDLSQMMSNDVDGKIHGFQINLKIAHLFA